MGRTTTKSVVDAQVETITPDLALEYLNANRNNRKIRQSRVDVYATAMAGG